MKFQPGNPGKPKGTKNKTSAEAAQSVLDALDELGGVSWLIKIAQDDPKTFTPLLAKLLPKDMSVNVTGSLRVGRLDQDETRTIETLQAIAAEAGIIPTAEVSEVGPA